MSTAVEPGTDTDFVDWAVPLLTEYAGKLKQLAEEAREFWKNSTTGKVLSPYGTALRDDIARRWKYLKGPTEELARQVSGVLEQGRITGRERVELWLRLAEFEHYIGLTQDYIGRIAAIK